MTRNVIDVIQAEIDADPGPNPPSLAERIALALGAADLLWRPSEPICEHDWSTDTCPKCGAKRERGPLPSCGWGPCRILEGIEYHDPHCPSLRENRGTGQ